MARNSKRCSTIGCRKTATQIMTYSFPESRNQPETDLVCKPCGESYSRRPVLKATVVKIPHTK